MRSFPPESMAYLLDNGTSCGLLPRRFYGEECDANHLRNLPILHMSQSLTLYNEISFVRERDYDRCDDDSPDPPMRMHLETRIARVEPRKVGMFVTSVTTYHQPGTCIATSQMVALILGLDPDMVIPFMTISVDGPRMGRCDRGSNIGNDADEVDIDKKTTVVQYRIPRKSSTAIQAQWRLQSDSRGRQTGFEGRTTFEQRGSNTKSCN